MEAPSWVFRNRARTCARLCDFFWGAACPLWHSHPWRQFPSVQPMASAAGPSSVVLPPRTRPILRCLLPPCTTPLSAPPPGAHGGLAPPPLRAPLCEHSNAPAPLRPHGGRNGAGTGVQSTGAGRRHSLGSCPADVRVRHVCRCLASLRPSSHSATWQRGRYCIGHPPPPQTDGVPWVSHTNTVRVKGSCWTLASYRRLFIGYDLLALITAWPWAWASFVTGKPARPVLGALGGRVSRIYPDQIPLAPMTPPTLVHNTRTLMLCLKHLPVSVR